MNRLLEFAVHHYFLVPAAVILAVVGIIVELRLRGRGTLAVSPADAVHIINRGGVLVLDVRDSKDFEAGHIIDARSIPAKELQGKLDTFKKYKEKPVLVYCDNGTVSAAAAQALRTQGFSKVVTLGGGLQSWRQDNLPVMRSSPVKRKDGKAA